MLRILSRTTPTSISAHLLLMVTRPPAVFGNGNNYCVLTVHRQGHLSHHPKGCCQPMTISNIGDSAWLSIELGFSNVLEIQPTFAVQSRHGNAAWHRSDGDEERPVCPFRANRRDAGYRW